MVNRWIEHIKNYAKEHNIPYGCAISKAKETYVKNEPKPKKEKKPKQPKLSKIDELRKYYPDQLKSLIKKLGQYKDKGDLQRGLQMARQIISNKSKPDDFKKYFKENKPNAYGLVFEDD